VTAPRSVVQALQGVAEREPAAEFVLDLERLVVSAAGAEYAVFLPEAIRGAFLSGQWDGTSLLLSRHEDVRALAAQLPYLAGFPRE
jgi:3-isopropylmalate/(R)-2-methylmalate dehydratase small subunit